MKQFAFEFSHFFATSLLLKGLVKKVNISFTEAFKEYNIVTNFDAPIKP